MAQAVTSNSFIYSLTRSPCQPRPKKGLAMKVLSKEMLSSKKNSRRMVLIDDDPAYCSILSTFAHSRGLELDTYHSLQEMGSIGKMRDYALAIVDYDLGIMSGVEVAEYIPIFFGDMPLILISGNYRVRTEESTWPEAIKDFVHKGFGPDGILDVAMQHLPPHPELDRFRALAAVPL